MYILMGKAQGQRQRGLPAGRQGTKAHRTKDLVMKLSTALMLAVIFMTVLIFNNNTFASYNDNSESTTASSITSSSSDSFVQSAAASPGYQTISSQDNGTDSENNNRTDSQGENNSEGLNSGNTESNQESSDDNQQSDKTAESKLPADDDPNINSDDEQSNTASSSSVSTLSSGSGGGAISSPSASSPGGSFSSVNVDPQTNTGIAATSIPIEVPPGRKDLAPQISLNYNSNESNGWVGVGWMLDMGAIQRDTMWGVDYNADDYIFTSNSASSRLLPRGDWGTDYYGAEIEGAFSKYFYNSSTGGWEVTAKNGTRYFFGTTAASRQDDDPVTPTKVFKWALDRVEDTNGNYMEILYTKDQGEIYLDEIKYTGNNSLAPSNSVKFILESTHRTDAHEVYGTHFSVKTDYRLKTIEVYGNGQLARKYELIYNYSPSTHRSLLDSVTLYGSSGTSLPPLTFTYSVSTQGFSNSGISWQLPDDERTTFFGNSGVQRGTFSSPQFNKEVQHFGQQYSYPKWLWQKDISN